MWIYSTLCILEISNSIYESFLIASVDDVLQNKSCHLLMAKDIGWCKLHIAQSEGPSDVCGCQLREFWNGSSFTHTHLCGRFQQQRRAHCWCQLQRNYIFERASSMDFTSCDLFWSFLPDLALDFLAGDLPATFLTFFARAFLAAFFVIADVINPKQLRTHCGALKPAQECVKLSAVCCLLEQLHEREGQELHTVHALLLSALLLMHRRTDFFSNNEKV